MKAEAVTRGMLFLSLVVTGVPGNAAVIGAFLSVSRTERLGPADTLVLQLAWVNLLVVSVRCLLEVLATFEIRNAFDDAGCRAVIFLYRTCRALSIWLTFALSLFQSLSVAPPGTRRAALRSLLAQHLPLVLLTLWVLNSGMSVAPLMYAVGARNDSVLALNAINMEFCFLSFPSRLERDANGAAQVGRDVVPMALMAAASLVLLVFLCRRGQARDRRGPGELKDRRGPSAERRAALAVVTLVSLYLLFYGVDNGLWVYTLTVPQTLGSSLVSDLRIFFSSLYAAVSPVVILISNRKVHKVLRCGTKAPSDAHRPQTELG